jgi:hypothetical protein
LKISLPRGETAILFAILFILIGFVAPIAYVSVAPQSHFVEVHDFDASDTYNGADEHNVCFERTVHKPTDVDITIELVLLRADGSVVEEDSFEIDAYYQQGRERVIIPRQLRSDSISAGEYRYVHSVELVYYNGRATKQFTFTSDKFTVHENKSQFEKANTEMC